MTIEETLTMYGFSDEDVDYTSKMCRQEELTAKKFFLKEGDISDRLAIVRSGLLRTFFYNDNADEVTTHFHEPNSLIISIDSFNNKVPAKENIVVVDDCELYTITLENWIRLYNDVPKWHDICKTSGDHISMKLLERTTELQTMSATDRYRKFCKEHPLVYQKATLGQIASYLGIDIATLSRIRKKV